MVHNIYVLGPVGGNWVLQQPDCSLAVTVDPHCSSLDAKSTQQFLEP